MSIRPVLAIASAILIVSQVHGYAATEDGQYATLVQKSQRLQVLASKNARTLIENKEMLRLQEEVAQIARRWSLDKVSPNSGKPDGIMKRGQEDWRRAHGLEPKLPKKEDDAGFCDPKNNLYVRADRLDTYLYGIQSLDAAKGAALTYTNDTVTGHRTTNVSGVVSYVIIRDICIDPPKGSSVESRYLSGYAIAPWVYANGALNNFNPKTEQSSLKYGVDAQFVWIGGPFFDANALIASPYYQTDFRDRARVYGVTASWQPQSVDWHLGGTINQGNRYLDWFWQFSAELDVRDVQVAGLTQLNVGNYNWLGTTTRLHLFLLPTVFNHRLHAVGTFQAYWDARSSISIWKYVASLAYNLTDDGNASISVEYDRGIDKDTLSPMNQYLVKLNAKY